MRTLAYAVLFIGGVLGIVNLTLTNSLASEGEFLKSVSQEKDATVQEISRLGGAMMEAQSLGRTESRARELGLIEPVREVRF